MKIPKISKLHIEFVNGNNIHLLSKKRLGELFNGFLIYINAPQEWKVDYEKLKTNDLVSFSYNINADNGSCYIDDHNIRKIKIESDGTIKTFITFVHEFMHYISLKTDAPNFHYHSFLQSTMKI